MSSAPLASFSQLRDFFMTRGIPHLADPAAQTIECAVQLPPLDGSLYLRWESTVPILQIIYILCFDLPLERIAAVETACCRVNASMSLPGFGIDYTRRNQYFRVTVPVVDPLPSLTLERLLLAVAGSARDFLPTFQRVIAGSGATEIPNNPG